MKIIVGVADMRYSSAPEDVIITYSLGSCIGLTLFDSEKRIGGLLHCMLPLSKIDAAKAEANPFIFIDSGVTAFLQSLFDLGAQRKSLVAKVAGGSHIMDDKGIFNIGERNNTVVRKMLWKNNILISGEDVGGSIPRTMSLDLATGKTLLKANGEEREL
ncbi:MAG TPA: chemotaxis protein CheD [Fibrobacteria bacterium]|nr:chemotaxis protein CheD [Fibrobacteria bacterium]